MENKKIELLIEVTSPTIYENFAEVKNALVEQTKIYEIEVTADTVKNAKVAAADINKMKAAIKEKARGYLDQLEAPVKEFKAKLKELEAVLDGRRSMITEQITTFDDVYKKVHVAAMQTYLDELIENENIREEFACKLYVGQFASLAGLTASGNLNKKSREQCEFLVRTAAAEQKQTDTEAENQRLRDEARAEKILREREAAAAAKAAAAPEPEKVESFDDIEKELEEFADSVPEPAQPKQMTADKAQPQAPAQEKPTQANLTQSEYVISVDYRIMAASGINGGAVVNAVRGMIERGEIPIASIEAREMGV